MNQLHDAQVKACAEYAAKKDHEDIERQTVTYRDAKVESTAHAAYWKKLDELEKWEALPEPVPSEALVKEQRLSTLRGELDALGAMLDTPAPPEQATPQQPRTAHDVSPIEWETVPLPELYRPPASPVADTAPEQQAAPPVAVSAAPAKRRRKPAWATVTMPYMKTLFNAGSYKSAAVFYKALMRRAGEPDSPFKLVNRELYCAKAGTTVSAGTLGNAWAEIRGQ